MSLEPVSTQGSELNPENQETIQNEEQVYAVVADTDMGKPLFNAPDGGRIDILREWEDVTNSELQQGSGT